MTTSRTSFLSEIIAGEPIPIETLAYFRQRLQNRLYEVVVSEFITQARESNLTKAEIARRIHSTPSQMTRWLASPGNWTSDTVSDLLLGMGAELGELSTERLVNRAPRNYTQPTWTSVSAGQAGAPSYVINNVTTGTVMPTITAAPSMGAPLLRDICRAG
jgi:hypothetical protein